MSPVKSVSNKKGGGKGVTHSTTSKRTTSHSSVATRSSSLSSTANLSGPARQLKEQAEGLLKKLILMAEGNIEAMTAVVGVLEAAVKLVENSRPKLHSCLICAYHCDTEVLFDAHFLEHQKGMKYCCAFTNCNFASESSGPVVEHVKRKHFTDEFDLRVANNYVHEM